MKKKLTFSLLVAATACCGLARAGGDYLRYEYDAAGNRVGRAVAVAGPQQSPKRGLHTAAIAVSPTVTRDAVTITTAADLEKTPMKYALISVQGDVLQSGDVKSQPASVSLGSYAAGMYLLTIESGSGTETFKIIKQ